MIPRLVCLAHRGASAHAPENTLAAFKKAIELGADWIELDVYAVEDRLLVFHDKRLERTTNGTGLIFRRGLAYLRGLDAGQGEKIPFLSEVVEAVDRRVGINIELKGENTARRVVDLLNRYVKQGWRYDDFLVSSFSSRQIKEAGEACPRLPLALNMKKFAGDHFTVVPPGDLFSIHIDRVFASAEDIRKIHDAGCQAYIFTANSEEAIQQLAMKGADGVFTDFPERVINAGNRSKKIENFP